MTKSSAAAPKDETPVVAVVDLTLTEFCARLSETVRRPELISAFEYTELAAGHLKDTAEAFQARFDTFVNTPV